MTEKDVAEMLSRLRKSRSANRNVVKGMIIKAKEVSQQEIDDEKRQEMGNFLRIIKMKQNRIVDLDIKIQDLIEEDKIDEDVEAAADFEFKIVCGISQIEKLVELEEREEVVAPEVANSPRAARATRGGVKLPKMEPKKFKGDCTKWQHFYDTFNAAVHSIETLTTIEKYIRI